MKPDAVSDDELTDMMLGLMEIIMVVARHRGGSLENMAQQLISTGVFAKYLSVMNPAQIANIICELQDLRAQKKNFDLANMGH